MDGQPHVILIPIAYNDGEPVPDEFFDRIILEISVKFGGATFLPPAIGGWIDGDGKFQPDKHRPLMVVVPKDREEEIVEWAKYAGKELGQEVMLLMRNFCEAHFIEIDSDPW